MTPLMRTYRDQALEWAEQSRISRLFDLGDKEAPPPRVYVPRPRKPRVNVRTAAQEQLLRRLVAAWIAEPKTTIRVMRERFHCSLRSCRKARLHSLTPNRATEKETP